MVRVTEREKLKQVIAELEAQRVTLGDGIADVSIAALRAKLAALEPLSLPQQRKQATILFAEVLGLAAMSETLDTEEVNDMMNALWQRWDAVIVERGGFIDKHAGGSLMALWGVLEAREDDPEQAICAALAMRSGLLTFCSERQVELSMRAGLNTGLVLLGGVGTTGEYSAIGDAVNLASRVTGIAPAGGVLVSHHTYHHVRGVFDVVEQEPVRVKGKARPVRTYLVERARPRPFRLLTPGVAGVETRMVGRDAELLMLQDICRDATEDAEARIVTIVGDPGVGKTRLLYEFEKWVERLSEEPRYFRGRAAPEAQATPYGLVRRMFALRFKILESDSAAEVRAKFRAGMAAALSSDQADLVGQLLGLDFSGSRAVQARLGSESFAELATAHLTRYVRATASQPTMIFLEDIHWADDSSLDLIDYLVTAVPDTRLLVICLARPTLFERRPSWGEGQETHTWINLRPLSRRASRALVGKILQKAGEIPQELRDLIVDGAEGNPSYVEELIKMLIEDGVIVAGEDHWGVELERLAEVRVPPTLTGVLQARLDTLPPAEKMLLQRASVVGRLFWAAVVAELARNEFEADRVDRLLEDVRERELIFRREFSAFEGTDEYIFKHALLRDVAYETVLLKLRRVCHAQVAQWLEVATGERISEYLGLIARHYELAGEAARAVDFWQRMGEESLQVGAFRDAVSAFERALALSPAVSRDRAPGASPTLPDGELVDRALLLVNLGNSYNRVGDYLVAIQHLEQGLALARQAGDPQVEIAALNRLAQVATEQGTYDRAQSYLDEVLVLAREEDDSACVASTLSMLSTIAWRWGDIEQAQACCHESLAIYRELGERNRTSQMLNILGILATLQEKYERAEQYYEQGLRMAREIEDRQLVADLLNNLGYLHHHSTGNLEEAREHYQESLRISREIDHRSGATSTLNNLGQLYVLFGEHQTAWGYLREALVESVAIGAVPLTLDALVGVVQQQIEVGQHVSAAELLGLALDHPALEFDVRQVAESALGRLRKALPTGELEAAMARGRVLELDTVVAELGALGAETVDVDPEGPRAHA
jgi:class 3 adenylate cyclase/tetratricopeptide (TPR) repeat protein